MTQSVLNINLSSRTKAWQVLVSALVVICQATTGYSNNKPNVVLILADDLGWSDTTLFGTTKLYRTPNIERLAARGMMFTRAYSSSPLCSPTRASILTGLSPARTGITTPNCHLPKINLQATPGTSAGPNQKSIQPESVSRLDTEYYTLAEMFKDNGYATGHFGKWHLGATPYSPLEHGFDVDVPHWPGPGPAGSYVAPWKFPDFDPQTPDQHIEDRMAVEAVRFMERNRDTPFFLNYWMFSVHAPFDAKRALIEKYRTLVDPADPQRSPTYAAMIESMDDAVGTLLNTLDRLKLADNTIVIFASDNGGNMYNEIDGTTPTSNAPLRGGKATLYEGGIRGPAIITYPGTVKLASRCDEAIQSSDFYPTLLELLGLAARPGQSFDGISIVPALKGKPLNRDAIFTYFPHSPGVPDWLPPAVCVHQENWKLIRIFFGGEDGKHRWKLFNLNEDPGEQNDLSATMQERTAQMDLLIDNFLLTTNAVQPTLNPKFDPTRYDPQLEGKAVPKGTNKRPKDSANKKPAAKTVAGWQPLGTSTLALQDETIVINSTGGDPHLSYALTKPVVDGQCTLLFRLSSTSKGNGQIFWQEQGVSPAFHRDRSKPLNVVHDGKEHEYSVSISAANTVMAVRIDPSAGPGTMKLFDVRLETQDGKLIERLRR